jgi:hypothetical protein
MTRQTELPDEKEIERRIERMRNLECDGHAAAWKRQHDHVIPALEVHQAGCELDSCMTPIFVRLSFTGQRTYPRQ